MHSDGSRAHSFHSHTCRTEFILLQVWTRPVRFASENLIIVPLLSWYHEEHLFFCPVLRSGYVRLVWALFHKLLIGVRLGVGASFCLAFPGMLANPSSQKHGASIEPSQAGCPSLVCGSSAKTQPNSVCLARFASCNRFCQVADHWSEARLLGDEIECSWPEWLGSDAAPALKPHAVAGSFKSAPKAARNLKLAEFFDAGALLQLVHCRSQLGERRSSQADISRIPKARRSGSCVNCEFS